MSTTEQSRPVFAGLTLREVYQLVTYRQKANQKFTYRDVLRHDRLRETATTFTVNYSGDFDFMIKMRWQVGLGRQLTEKQAAAVLNCLYADYCRDRYFFSAIHTDERGVYQDWQTVLEAAQ